MPQLPNRAKYERVFTDQVSAMFAKQRRAVGKILREGGKPDADFWKQVAKETRTNTSLLMLPVHERGGKTVSKDTEAIKESARQWSLEHSKDLAEGLNRTSKKALQELSKLVKQQKGDKGKNKLIDEGLKTIFGSSRAELIAVTEVTTAYTAGQMAVVGKKKDGIWRISDRGNVCPKCRKLNGKRRKTWSKVAPNGSPLHGHCNCWIEWDV